MAETVLATEATAITYSGFEGIEDKEFYARNVLQPLREEHILDQFFEKITMPRNHGKTYTYRKYGRIVPRTEKLEEGVLPDPNTMGMTEYSMTIDSYGDWIKYTDESKIFPIDNIVGQLTQEMGYSAKDFFDIKRVEGLEKTKNVWYAGTTGTAATAPGASTKGIVLEDLNRIHAFFRRNNVKPGADGTYALICPPEAIIPLKSLTKDSTKYTYVEILQGQQSKLIYEGADGKLLGFTFVVSNSIKVENKKANCYILGKVRGKWGVAEVNIESEGKEIIHKPLSSGGTENALNQVGSVGWKLHGYGTAVMADEAVVRYVINLDDDFDAFEEAQRSNIKAGAVVKGEYDENAIAAANTVNGIKVVEEEEE